MTFAQQLKQQGLEQGLQQGLEEGEHRKAIAKRLITQGKPIQYIQDLTGLPENEVMDLVQ